jgi:hypothetical protein
MTGTKQEFHFPGEETMKNTNFLIIILLTVFLLSAADSWAKNWTLLGTDPNGTEYYKPSDVKKVTKNIVHVRTKIIYNERGKFRNFSRLTKTEKNLRNPYILNFEMKWIEFNCTTRQYRLLSGGIYDKRGKLISDLPPSGKKWSRIPAGSPAEKLMDLLCGNTDVTKNNGSKNKKVDPE